MPATSPIILFGDNAIAVEDDATFSATDVQPFVNLADLETELASNRYATNEPNFWLLDGRYKFMPTTPHVGLMSGSLSNGSGNYAAPVVLTINFSTVHSTTDGLTLFFNSYTNDYINSLSISYYDNALSLIRTDNYTPAAVEFSTGQAVSNFKRIVITFNSSNKAYRFARLIGIDFDTVTRFTGDSIKSAQLVEHIDPTSITLPFNTLDITLFSSDGDFSIVDPGGVFATLQYKKPLDAYEQINDNMVYLGRFYLNEWNSQSENIADLHAVDILGILDKIDYHNDYFAVDNVATVIQTLLTASGVGVTASVDAVFSIVVPFGSVPAGSYRESIQNICFGVGAYATCARSKYLQIRPLEIASTLSVFDYTVVSSEKHISSLVKLRPLVTGIEVVQHEFDNSGAGTPTDLFKAALAIGTHLIVWDGPAYVSNIFKTGGLVSVDTYGVSYMISVVSVAGAMEITGITYPDNRKVISQYNGGLPAGTVPNIVRVEDVTMANKFNTGTAFLGWYPNTNGIVASLYSYFNQRYIQQTKLFASLIAPGDSVLIDTQSSKQIKGIAEKITTDLTGGFISNLEIVGVVA